MDDKKRDSAKAVDTGISSMDDVMHWRVKRVIGSIRAGKMKVMVSAKGNQILRYERLSPGIWSVFNQATGGIVICKFGGLT